MFFEFFLEFLMKKKTKISKLLTDQQLEKISHLSKILGKNQYLETIIKVTMENDVFFKFFIRSWISYTI